MNSLHEMVNTLAGDAGFQSTDVADMRGRTVLVTGGTAGIGFEVARAFADSRARVLLLSRRIENGDRAAAEIKKLVSEAADVHFIECDLGNLEDVKQVGDKIRESEERLDVVIADAGVGVNSFDLSSDGIDRHFSVNHLGHFLLINRLLPLIRKTSMLPNTPPARIVSISSELHRLAPSTTRFTSKEEVTEVGSRNLSAVSLYARSKLANILFTRYTLVERAIRPTGHRIFALATHPLFGGLLKAVTVPFMRSPEQGSLSTLWAATSDDIEKNSWQGCYFTDPGELGKETPQARNEDLGENLHKLSEELVREKLGEHALFSWEEGSL